MRTSSDKNVLFGILAAQNHLVDPQQLIEAFQIWSLNQEASIQAIVEQNGWMKQEDIRRVEALIQEYSLKNPPEPQELQSGTASPRFYETGSGLADPEDLSDLNQPSDDKCQAFGGNSIVFVDEQNFKNMNLPMHSPSIMCH